MIKMLSTLVLASAIAAAGCASPASVDNVPVGAEVEVIRQDGGVVKGTLTERNAETLKVYVGAASRSVPRREEGRRDRDRAVGGGGGAAVVLSTAGDEVRMARGASLTIPIDRAVDVRVPITKAP